jgi:hypothetical protein
VLGQNAVDERIVRGQQRRDRRLALEDDVFDEATRLLEHAGGELGVQLGQRLRARADPELVCVGDPKPATNAALDVRASGWRREQPLELRAKVELTSLRRGPELVVRRQAGDSVGE